MNDVAEQHAIKIPRTQGEEIRRFMVNKDIFNRTMKIIEKNGFLYLPLKEETEKNEILNELRTLYPGAKMETMMFEVIGEKDSGDYKRFLSSIPIELYTYLPTSFDVIGNLCIIKIQKEVRSYVDEIAHAIMNSQSHISGVFLDQGVKGQLRVRHLKHIAGEQQTITTHREYGITMKVDIGNVYFSPRLAGERFRIANLVKDNECILDMFTGIGPFSLMIAKYVPTSNIHAIDINEDAIKLLNENIKLNKVKNITPHHGDATIITPKLGHIYSFDRIIMNLPLGSLEFLDLALKLLSQGSIHLYTITERKDIDKITKFIEQLVTTVGKELISLQTREIKGYSPTEAFMAHDVEIRK